MTDRKNFMNEYECGKMDDAEFHACVERALGGALPFGEFKAAWNDIFLDPIHDTVRVAESLLANKHIKLGILSNNNPMHWLAIKPVVPLVTEFEHIFLSHEIGHKKPDAGAFLHALETMSVDPARTIFVDDLAENITAATRVGMKTIHATNPKAVRDGFAAHGIKI